MAKLNTRSSFCGSKRFGEGISWLVSQIHVQIGRRWRFMILYQATLLLGLALYIYTVSVDHRQSPQLAHNSNSRRSWGGYDHRPVTEQCYRQERTATLLALCLGVLGVDQFYARHWVLAVFKLLTAGACGIWALVECILWIMGDTYGTPGCPGGYGPGGEWRY